MSVATVTNIKYDLNHKDNICKYLKPVFQGLSSWELRLQEELKKTEPLEQVGQPLWFMTIRVLKKTYTLHVLLMEKSPFCHLQNLEYIMVKKIHFLIWAFLKRLLNNNLFQG